MSLNFKFSLTKTCLLLIVFVGYTVLAFSGTKISNNLSEFSKKRQSVKLANTVIPFANFPDYPGGEISSIYNSGPGMAVDQLSTTSEDSEMVVISKTNKSTFTTYIQSLIDAGFTQVNTNEIENNLFYTFMNDSKLYYVYYTGIKREVRIIQDISTRTALSELDAIEQGSGGTEFYLYSLDHTHGEGQTSKVDYWKIDCGAMLIMKLKDNSLFLVDAGHERQSSQAALDGLLDFMYKITEQEVGTTINIRAWFYSHAHGDHVYMTYPFLEQYHDLINIESVLFNIPSYHVIRGGYDSGTFLMKQTFNTYYPNCKYVKLHTGQSFSLQGVTFDVLFTHEDAVSSDGASQISNFNDTSTILQITMDGKKIMLLGDLYGNGESNLLKMFSGDILKSDCVQTSHHGYNDVKDLYSVIKAPLALYCNSRENAKDNNLTKYEGVINATNNVKTLFADPDTHKITVENGELISETVPSYRSYFKTVSLPDLSEDVESTNGGNRENLNFVINQTSLLSQLIDKSVTGTAAASVNESPYRALDGTNSTKYCTELLPATIAWTMKRPVTLRWYAVFTGNDTAENEGRNPQKWVLSGSNDGENWTTIDAVDNANLPKNNFAGTAFSVSNPLPYKYYALKVFANDGDDVMQFSEFKLFGDLNAPTALENVDKSVDYPFSVSSVDKNKILFRYNNELNSEIKVSIFNLLGVQLIDMNIEDMISVFDVPSSGVYVVSVSDSKLAYSSSKLVAVR